MDPKGLAKFALHSALAVVGSMILGVLLLVLSEPLLGETASPWKDFPYSPLLWGMAFVLGFLVNRVMRDRSAYWVWIIPALWLGYHIVETLKWYDPRWCHGCSAAQYVWYNYFSYHNAMQEGMGEIFATTPMLNSIAYSTGAALGQKFKGSAGPKVTETEPDD